MNFKLRSLVAATLAGSMLMGFGVNAMADSTTDIVNALVAKGVLTEEEGALLTKGRTDEAAGQAKALKKASKLKVSDAVDNATIYGSFRFREEYRNGEGYSSASAATTADSERTRSRGKFELGVKTESGSWYSDVAFVTGSSSSARSDNFTFGNDSNTEFNPKETIYLKRAMLGVKATDWLTLEGGRMKNPLYTTKMVWDGDYSVSGATEKLNFNTKGGTKFFAVLGQWANYKMDRTLTDNYSTGVASVANKTGEIYAFQGGIKTPITDATSAKAAVTHYVYGTPTSRGGYTPGASNRLSAAGQFGVNHLDIWEIPAEINMMASSNLGVRLFGDYVYNNKADERAAAAGITSNVDDNSWMLGVKVASAKDLKSFEGDKQKEGDWSAALWYQKSGAFAQDQNLNDSDLFDSRLNMKGVVLNANYLFRDNVQFDLTAASAKRNNDSVGTNWSAGADISKLNLTNFKLLQMDVTYKF
jgi:polyhydroxyalkanoate synthesis regulator phasin